LYIKAESPIPILEMRLQVVWGPLTLHENWLGLLEVILDLGFVITLTNFGGEVNKKFIHADYGVSVHKCCNRLFLSFP
jgi:hypothetical protein